MCTIKQLVQMDSQIAKKKRNKKKRRMKERRMKLKTKRCWPVFIIVENRQKKNRTK